jgi:hypothetical protein
MLFRGKLSSAELRLVGMGIVPSLTSHPNPLHEPHPPHTHDRALLSFPLLEPSRLFLLLRDCSATGPPGRPGQLAVEVSDCLLRENREGSNLPSQSS